MSSLFSGPSFSRIQDDVFSDWFDHPSKDPYDPDFTQQVQNSFGNTLSGQHYFTTEGLVVDFRSSGPTAGNTNAIVVAKVTGDIPAPTGDLDVDWQKMTAVSGKLGSTIFRVNTRSGKQTTTPSVSTSRSAMIAHN